MTNIRTSPHPSEVSENLSGLSTVSSITDPFQQVENPSDIPDLVENLGVSTPTVGGGSPLFKAVGRALVSVVDPSNWHLRRNRSSSPPRNHRARNRQGKEASIEKAVSKRYDEIEIWLMNKHVMEHDEICTHAIKTKSINNRNKNNKEAVTNKTCLVCHGEIQTDDIVSGSRNPACNHVFHHECIKEWLLDHSHCPICREVYLPIDSKQRAHWRSEGFLPRAVDCFYCYEHGIVRPSITAIQDPHLGELLKMRLKDVPDEEALKATRTRGFIKNAFVHESAIVRPITVNDDNDDDDENENENQQQRHRQQRHHRQQQRNDNRHNNLRQNLALSMERPLRRRRVAAYIESHPLQEAIYTHLHA